MKPTEFNRHQTPPGGWQFRQPQTGWTAPTPVSFTFNQQVANIIQHRLANPAITAKNKLSTDPDVVAIELENFNKKRLGVQEGLQPVPFRRGPGAGAGAAVGARQGFVASVGTLAHDIKRAAQGTAVVLDWLTSGGAPVPQELANKRAAVCAKCPQNVPGRWFTEAPAEIIRETLEARKDLKLETPFDGRLQSCDICKCLMRLKVWCPLEHVLAHTKPEIMAEFKPPCWIATRDQ